LREYREIHGKSLHYASLSKQQQLPKFERVAPGLDFETWATHLIFARIILITTGLRGRACGIQAVGAGIEPGRKGVGYDYENAG
jgi:hypothetical protein